MKLRRFHENKSEYFEEFCRITVQFFNIESGNQNILKTLSTYEFEFLSIQSLAPKYFICFIKNLYCLKIISTDKIFKSKKLRRYIN